ncbi:MAG: SpaA isopeptide-forming pilin-related protein, partial [Acutalibacteraceae bacterium]
YILYKVDQDNYGKRLPGAEFTLNSSTEEDLYTYITDQNGSFIISMPNQEEINAGAYPFKYNKLYYVIETKSPIGYELPTDPTRYYFYFSNTGEGYTPLDPSQIPEGAVDLSTTAHVVYCENIEIPVTSITVVKQWYDSSGIDITSSTDNTAISFDLYRIASTTPPSNIGDGEDDSNNVNFTYQVGYYNNSLINESTVIPKNSVVTVKVTATDDGLPDTVELTVNGSAVTIARNGTMEFSYTFTITEDTTVIGALTDWRFGNSGVASYTYVPPSATEPDTPEEPTEPEIPNNGTKIGTYSITKGSNWSWTKDDLPLTGVDENGNKVYYTYYVIEQAAANYTTTYENNSGITSGTIVINNTLKETPEYELPITGGPGIYLFTFGGLLLIIGAVLLLIYKQKRRGEEFKSS